MELPRAVCERVAFNEGCVIVDGDLEDEIPDLSRLQELQKPVFGV